MLALEFGRGIQSRLGRSSRASSVVRSCIFAAMRQPIDKREVVESIGRELFPLVAVLSGRA